MRRFPAAVVCCALTVRASAALGAAPGIGAGLGDPTTDRGYVVPAWCWDMADYRMQQPPQWQAGQLGLDGWPDAFFEPAPAMAGFTGAERLALIADDEPVSEDVGTPPLLSAIGRVARKFAVFRDVWTDVCEGLTVAHTDVVNAFAWVIEGAYATPSGPGETVVAVPEPGYPLDPVDDPSALTGMDYPLERHDWHQVPDEGGPLRVTGGATTQPSTAGATDTGSGANDTDDPMDVTEAEAPMEYDPYGEGGMFEKRFARDEEQFRY